MSNQQIAELTAAVVSAYISRNPVQLPDLPGLIATVSASLAALGQQLPEVEAKPIPAVNPRRSVFPDYLVSLEDGKRYKALKRHLGTHGLTPAEYRAKWGLPADYPMTAPNYSAARSALAKKAGLGRKPPLKAKRATKGR